MAKPIKAGSAGGEYMDAVVVLEWAAKIGDVVRAGDTLVTVETAKAATEVSAPCDGILTAIFAEVGSEVALTEILGLIGAAAGDTVLDGNSAEHGLCPEERASLSDTPPMTAPPAGASTHTGRIVASPAARLAAARAGLSLRVISPSSPSGRIKLRDIVGPSETFFDVIDGPPRLALPGDQPGQLKVYRTGPESGIPVVMLHGFASDAMSWYPLERLLLKSHRVIRIDLPNHGQSPQRRMRDFKQLAREIVDAFDALQLDSAHLVGHSLGGACALALADVRPRKIKSLSLLAPGGLGADINSTFGGGIARAARPESLEQWLKLLVSDQRLISSEFVGAAMASRSSASLRAAQQQMVQDIFPDGTQGYDLRAALGRVECPTRIIWGRNDQIIPWKHALQAPGRVALHIFDDVGHVPQFEIPDAVLEILLSAFSITSVKP